MARPRKPKPTTLVPTTRVTDLDEAPVKEEPKPVGIAKVYKKQRQLLVRAIRFKTWYYYTLVGANGQVLCTSENFTQKHNVEEVLRKYFYNFEPQDLTGE